MLSLFFFYIFFNFKKINVRAWEGVEKGKYDYTGKYGEIRHNTSGEMPHNTPNLLQTPLDSLKQTHYNYPQYNPREEISMKDPKQYLFDLLEKGKDPNFKTVMHFSSEKQANKIRQSWYGFKRKLRAAKAPEEEWANKISMTIHPDGDAWRLTIMHTEQTEVAQLLKQGLSNFYKEHPNAQK